MSMSDRKLMPMAAKAAAIKIEYEEDGSIASYWNEFGDVWEPLTDDGDALRLAAVTGLVVGCDGRGIEAKTVSGAIPSAWAVESEYGPPDHMARIRRAIVRAAAEIGRAMP